MDQKLAIEDILLGASMRQVAIAYRESRLEALQCRPEDVASTTFATETESFMKNVARHLGEKHRGNGRVQHALQAWVMECDHYEAWDALLAGFEFPGKSAFVRRGRMRFPGSLTAHWADASARD